MPTLCPVAIGGSQVPSQVRSRESHNILSSSQRRKQKRKTETYRTYLKQAWGTFDAMFPSRYRSRSSKRKFETLNHQWVHLFYHVSKIAQDNNLQLASLWKEGGWLFEAVSNRDKQKLSTKVFEEINRRLGIPSLYQQGRNPRNTHTSNHRDIPTEVSASQHDHTVSELRHNVKSEPSESELEPSESESDSYSDGSTSGDVSPLAFRIDNLGAHRNIDAQSSGLSTTSTTAVRIKTEATDTSSSPSPVQTSRLNGIVAKLSPRALNTQVAVSQHSQAKRRSEQLGSSSEDDSPVSMRRRPRPRRIITPEADQDSISSMQGSRRNIGIDKAFTREAFDETLSRWSSFAPAGGECNAGNKFAELEDCEKELRRSEESLKLAQQKHDEVHRQLEAIDQLIAVATPGQNEGDAAGIGRRRGEIWAPLLATAERTREVLEVEAREEVERLSTTVEVMRADVARLTDEAELQRLAKEVAKGMKDISKLMEKRR